MAFDRNAQKMSTTIKIEKFNHDTTGPQKELMETLTVKDGRIIGKVIHKTTEQ